MAEETHFRPSHQTETSLSRFFRKVSTLFSNKTRAGRVKLSGRISELHRTSEAMLRDLKSFRSKLEKKKTPHLFLLAAALIDPIVKEMTRLQKAIDSRSTATHQVKAVSRYVELIEKARTWVEVASGSDDPDMIGHVIIMQTIQDFTACLERDMQVIQDYLNHALESMTLSDVSKSELKKKLLPTLLPILLKLNTLKEFPQDLTIETLASWRSAADRKRESIFTEALHTIDTFFDQ